jgi:hypothetical protein
MGTVHGLSRWMAGSKKRLNKVEDFKMIVKRGSKLRRRSRPFRQNQSQFSSISPVSLAPLLDDVGYGIAALATVSGMLTLIHSTQCKPHIGPGLCEGIPKRRASVGGLRGKILASNKLAKFSGNLGDTCSACSSRTDASQACYCCLHEAPFQSEMQSQLE